METVETIATEHVEAKMAPSEKKIGELVIRYQKS